VKISRFIGNSMLDGHKSQITSTSIAGNEEEQEEK